MSDPRYHLAKAGHIGSGSTVIDADLRHKSRVGTTHGLHEARSNIPKTETLDTGQNLFPGPSYSNDTGNSYRGWISIGARHGCHMPQLCFTELVRFERWLAYNPSTSST